MNSFISAVSVCTLVSAPAFAGGPAAIPAEAEPAAPAAVAVHDWSGPYVGLSYGSASGEVQFLPGSFDDFNGASVAGAHLGYLLQRGSLVYGGEIAYGSVKDAGFDTFRGIETAIDLKARVGLAANRALFYAVIGYSQTDLYVDGGEWKMKGPAFGLGAEFALSDRIGLGIEYLSRDVSGEESSGFPVDAEGKVDTISLRLNLAF